MGKKNGREAERHRMKRERNTEEKGEAVDRWTVSNAMINEDGGIAKKDFRDTMLVKACRRAQTEQQVGISGHFSGLCGLEELIAQRAW